MILCAVFIIRDPSVLSLPFGGGQASSSASDGKSSFTLPFIRQTQSTPAPAAEKTAEPSAVQQQPAAETAQSPVPTPAPTPAPTPYVPTPKPYGKVLASGTISSGKPWLINIHADWAAVTAADNQTEVTVIVYADHYALDYGSTESLRISLGEDSVLLETNDIRTDINQPQSTELGRKTYTLPLREGETIELPLEVSWNFQGKYVDDAGHYFDVHGISCEGTVTITG